MKIKDVPQHPGILEDYGHEVCYAVDAEGNYNLVPSIGWMPKNIANEQAWEVIEANISRAAESILRGNLSPLGYYMACHQMDIRLLAKYMGLYGWQVKRHLKPKVFSSLKPSLLEKYAGLFKVPVDDMTTLADKLALGRPETDK
ncbi:hypothetical protein [uncultured Desulfobacter sp.]|uniref:hypothetical protein n=1 Tax=uncultured Desulfobacter sp. TaxID=240139 RepID=UPI002AAB10CF|nr:hypothetical protein [uncultured Desulfobacter sp.]